MSIAKRAIKLLLEVMRKFRWARVRLSAEDAEHFHGDDIGMRVQTFLHDVGLGSEQEAEAKLEYPLQEVVVDKTRDYRTIQLLLHQSLDVSVAERAKGNVNTLPDTVYSDTYSVEQGILGCVHHFAFMRQQESVKQVDGSEVGLRENSTVYARVVEDVFYCQKCLEYRHNRLHIRS